MVLDVADSVLPELGPRLGRLALSVLRKRGLQIIGSSRRAMTDEQFGELAGQAIAEFGTSKPTGEAWQAFQHRLWFASAEPGRTATLAGAIELAEREIGGTPGRLFHLAVPPAAFEPTVTMLGAAGLAPRSRVIIEKPFGTDLASARALNQTVHAIFGESQAFRIDHFLGKASVDNILAFRFAKQRPRPWSRYVRSSAGQVGGPVCRGGAFAWVWVIRQA